ncbi:hypothetical protein RCL_jg15019.t1 [Rhizophagus clarus]|uniref:Uncharacterized protein n=1 Tax=Rhizophagus clarus TaxID=94130 RepID=A0A8H3M2J3_9GLOM|nr:hypothetical protein RCL_jg15019.t1 [Rhizophagus clarus]
MDISTITSQVRCILIKQNLRELYAKKMDEKNSYSTTLNLVTNTAKYIQLIQKEIQAFVYEMLLMLINGMMEQHFDLVHYPKRRVLFSYGRNSQNDEKFRLYVIIKCLKILTEYSS